MTENQKNIWENVTLKSLATKLRRLPEVEVPETLEANLLAAIPERNPDVGQERQVRWWPGALSLGAAAAAVLILALVLIPSYAPSTPPVTPIIEPNGGSPRYVLADQNNAYVGNTEPCELQWPSLTLNEPGYRN